MDVDDELGLIRRRDDKKGAIRNAREVTERAKLKMYYLANAQMPEVPNCTFIVVRERSQRVRSQYVL